MARILYLHGRESTPNAGKAQLLRAAGHEVVGPQLDDADDLGASIATAEAMLADLLAGEGVDLIVGSSRGGGVAVGMDARGVPRLLLCPAWRNFGRTETVPPGTRILHAAADDLVPLEDSRELLARSGLPESAVRVAGEGHRLNDPVASAALLAMVAEMAG